jgi:DNA replication protein DnaC
MPSKKRAGLSLVSRRPLTEKELRHARIPERYWDAEILPKTVAESYCRKLKENLAQGIGLYLYGPNGVGKTYQVCAILKAAFWPARARAMFIAAPDLVDAFRPNSAMFDEDTTMAEALFSRKVLVIDDVGKEYRGAGTGFSEQQLDNLLRRRNSEKKVTLFTSNFNTEQVAKVYGENTKSLLFEACALVTLSGKDIRIAGQERNVEKAGLIAD